MYKTNLLKCDHCGAILVVCNDQLYKTKMVCDACQHPLRVLNDDFDLAEILEVKEKRLEH